MYSLTFHVRMMLP